MKKLFFCFIIGVLVSQVALQAQNHLYKDLYYTTNEVIKSNSPDLLNAIRKDDVDFLENYFSDENMSSLGLDCLLMSCVYNSSKTTQFLLDKEVNPALLKGDKNPLLHAVYNESINALQALLNTNLDLYPSLPKDHTLLHFVASHDKVQSLKPLVNAGMAINQTEKNGNTPLHIALLKGHSQCANQLIQLQADVNIANLNLMYPLHIAVEDNDEKATLNLLSAGANTQAINKDDFLPLHYAIQNENIDLVDLLLKFMPTIRIENNKKNIYDAAKRSKNKMIKDLVKDRVKAEKKLYASVRFNNPKCHESCDGQIWVDVQNGKPPYTYYWEHDPQIEGNTGDELCEGKYNIEVKDKKKKTYSMSVYLEEPKKLSTIVLKDFDTNNYPNANLKGLAEGGVPPYQYQWNDRSKGQYVFLESGNHQLTVTDVLGCSAEKTFDINASSKIIDTSSPTPNKTSNPTPTIENDDLVVSNEGLEDGVYSVPNNLLDFEISKALDYFEHENVNVIILSSKGNEVGRFTIRDYLNRLRLLNKYQPSIVEKEVNAQGKISLLYVNEVLK